MIPHPLEENDKVINLDSSGIWSYEIIGRPCRSSGECIFIRGGVLRQSHANYWHYYSSSALCKGKSIEIQKLLPLQGAFGYNCY